MIPATFDVRILVLEEGQNVDDVNEDDAILLAWPHGAPVPQVGDIFGYENEPHQVHDCQWHYHMTTDGSHLHFTMVLGDICEDEDD